MYISINIIMKLLITFTFYPLCHWFYKTQFLLCIETEKQSFLHLLPDYLCFLLNSEALSCVRFVRKAVLTLHPSFFGYVAFHPRAIDNKHTRFHLSFYNTTCWQFFNLGNNLVIFFVSHKQPSLHVYFNFLTLFVKLKSKVNPTRKTILWKQQYWPLPHLMFQWQFPDLHDLV